MEIENCKLKALSRWPLAINAGRQFEIFVLQFSMLVSFSYGRRPNPFAHANGRTHVSAGACFSNFPTTSLCSGGANSYASWVTTGVTKKFSVGGGDAVCHSRPGKFHGLACAIRP